MRDPPTAADTRDPRPPSNPPGQSSIDYRLADRDGFLSAMIEAAAADDRLDRWTARSPQDHGMLLLEMWATIGDVLTFYQERIANEAYLRTARHRDSLTQLARRVDYQPGPGAAATTRLAFAVDAEAAVTVPERTRVQHKPPDGGPPLVFETVEPVEASPPVNEVPVHGPLEPDPWHAPGAASVAVETDRDPPPPGSSIACFDHRTVEVKTVDVERPEGSWHRLEWTTPLQARLDPASARVAPLVRRLSPYEEPEVPLQAEPKEDDGVPGGVRWEIRDPDDAPAPDPDPLTSLPLDSVHDDIDPGSRVLLTRTGQASGSDETRLATVTATDQRPAEGGSEPVTHLDLDVSARAGPAIALRSDPSSGDPTVDVVVLAGDGTAWVGTREGTTWEGWRNLGGRLTSVDAARAPAGSEPSVLAGLGETRRVLARSAGHGGTWRDLGGPFETVAAATSGERVHLVARDADGRVHGLVDPLAADDPEWTDIGEATGSPTIVASDDGGVELLADGPDGDLVHARWNPYAETWTQPAGLGIAAEERVAVAADGSLDVLARARDGPILWNQRPEPGEDFGSWTRLELGLTGLEGAAARDDGLAVLGTDGGGLKLVDVPEPPASPSTTRLQPAGTDAAIEAGPGSVVVAVRDDGGRVHESPLSALDLGAADPQDLDPRGPPTWSVEPSGVRVHQLATGHVAAWPFTYPDEVDGRDLLVSPDVDGALEPDRTVAVVDDVGPGTTATVDRVETRDADGDGVADHLRVTLEAPLPRPFDGGTARLHGNVAEATHGETVEAEVLGDGDATEAFQTFELSKEPLAFLPEPAAPGGLEGAIELRVDGVEWHEDRLAASDANDPVFETDPRPDGPARVRFGDGEHGRRLPSGRHNVTATYRTGIGTQGNVPAGTIESAIDRPAGLDAVTNPVEATGGVDPEPAEAIREGIPDRVRSMGRVVSLRDHETAALDVPCIAKARASWDWIDETRAVVLTVVPQDGERLTRDCRQQARDHLDARRNPNRRLEIRPHETVPLEVEASLEVDGDHRPDEVQAAARRAVLDLYSLESVELGEDAPLSRLYTAISNVPGVLGVDVHRFAVADLPTGRVEAAEQQRRLQARGVRGLDDREGFAPDPVQRVVRVRPCELVAVDSPAEDVHLSTEGTP